MKDNQPRLHDALAALCAEREPSDRLETVDRGRHGRQEHRRVEVLEVEGRLDPDRRPWIACAARVARLTWRKDTRTGLWTRAEETALYACQARLDAAPLGRAVRAHWGSRTVTTTCAIASCARTTAASGVGPASSPGCARSRSTSCGPAGSAT
jgi:hypothetical protein